MIFIFGSNSIKRTFRMIAIYLDRSVLQCFILGFQWNGIHTSFTKNALHNIIYNIIDKDTFCITAGYPASTSALPRFSLIPQNGRVVSASIILYHNPYKVGSFRCRFRASLNSSLTQTSNVFARSISISPFSSGSSPYIS